MSDIGTRRLHRTLVAVGWSYGGRVAGLAWTLLLVTRLDITAYGYYSLAFALSAGLGVLDHPFDVRAIRGAQDRFAGERRARTLLGASLLVAGLLALVPAVRADGSGPWQVVWFGLVVVGGEICFNALQSVAVRAGDPQVVTRRDTARQVTSIVLGTAVLLLLPDPGVLEATAAYAVPYLVLAVVALVRTRADRPLAPGRPAEVAGLISEHAGTFVFLIADVLVLGVVAGPTVAGYFGLAQAVVVAVITLGHAFTMTYHEPLREQGGRRSAGPPTSHVTAVAVASSLAVLAAAAAIAPFGPPVEVLACLVLLAPFAATRTVVSLLVLVLYARHQDAARIRTVWAVTPLKLVALSAVLAAGLGAAGAAAAASAVDVVLCVLLARAVRRGDAEVGP